MKIAEFLDFLYCIVSMITMICAGEWTFHWTTRNGKKIARAVVLYLFALVIHFFPGTVHFPLFLLFYAGELGACFMLVEKPTGKKFLGILIIFIFVGYINGIIQAFLDLLLGGFFSDHHAERSLAAIFIVLLLSFIVVRTEWFQVISKYCAELSKGRLLVIILVVFLETGMFSLGSEIESMFADEKSVALFRFLITADLLVVTCMIFWFAKECYQRKYYYEQVALKEELLNALKNYYNSLYEKDKEMRKFRHEISNQLGILQMLMEKGEIEKAKEQLRAVNGEYRKAVAKKIHVGDDMLDAVLSMYCQKAEKDHVSLDIRGKIDSIARYDIYLLCSIFSNAINNAVEACRQLGDNLTVTVRIMELKVGLYCSFENPATETMYRAIRDGRTSKEDQLNHGYGVEVIKHSIEGLNGHLEYRYENGKVLLEIWI